jgi:effector-binding domain-containing protein
MKTTEPKVEERAALHYAGIRTQVLARQFPKIIPQFIGEVFGWLDKQSIAPSGAPLMRYYVINMKGLMDVEIGVPVESAITGDGRVSACVLPAGKYASLVYTGVKNGIKGNGALLDWGAKQGLVWDRWDDTNGDAFGGRVEFFLDGPEDDPDPAKWDTEVAIRLVDE